MRTYYRRANIYAASRPPTSAERTMLIHNANGQFLYLSTRICALWPLRHMTDVRTNLRRLIRDMRRWTNIATHCINL